MPYFSYTQLLRTQTSSRVCMGLVKLWLQCSLAIFFGLSLILGVILWKRSNYLWHMKTTSCQKMFCFMYKLESFLSSAREGGVCGDGWGRRKSYVRHGGYVWWIVARVNEYRMWRRESVNSRVILTTLPFLTITYTASRDYYIAIEFGFGDQTKQVLSR
jgi:hypothetical protein